MPDTELWGRAGETITCINGHPICDLAKDITMGEPRDGAHFVNWRQPEPTKTTSVAAIRCATCRGVWIRGSTRGGYQFHFADGWR